MTAALVTIAMVALVEDADFVGFSEDEVVAAWRLHIANESEDGRFVDRYAVLRVTRLEDGQSVASFRDGPVRRYTPDGRLVTTSVTPIAGLPMLRDAKNRREWERYARRHHFSAQRRSSSTSVVDVSRSSGDVERTGGRIAIRGTNGVSYALEATLQGGRKARLGHFGLPSTPGQSVARISAYASPTGLHVAIVNRIEIRHEGRVRHVAQPIAMRLPGIPLASSGRQLTAGAEVARGLYASPTVRVVNSGRY